MDLKKLFNSKWNKKEKIDILKQLGYAVTKFDEEKIMNEDLLLTSYQCNRGVWTIGIGCTYYRDGSKVAKGEMISLNEAWELYQFHKRKVELIISKHFSKEELENMGEVRKNVVMDLVYNMGESGVFKGFPAMIKALRTCNWERASLELKYADVEKGVLSKYFRQIGNRAVENVRRLKEGR